MPKTSLHDRRAGSTGRAFTLIELLVSVAIISVLLSILLPSMAGARRAAQRAVCMANLREIGKGVSEYTNDNEDWIVGSPGGSGAYLTSAFASGPAVQVWDFMGPLAKQFGIQMLEGKLTQDTISRFNYLRSSRPFLCPSNSFLAPNYDGPDAGIGPMVSYNTVRYMMMEHESRAKAPNFQIGLRYYDNAHEQKIPRNWSPRITRIGVASNKVFAADGSRYATESVEPDYDLKCLAQWGGAFSDAGPYSTFTRSWDRSWAANGNGNDARIYAYRHGLGQPEPYQPADAMRMNILFFDAHVETQGDLESAAPWQWLQAGSTLEGGSLYRDVERKYGPGPFNISS